MHENSNSKGHVRIHIFLNVGPVYEIKIVISSLPHRIFNELMGLIPSFPRLYCSFWATLSTEQQIAVT